MNLNISDVYEDRIRVVGKGDRLLGTLDEGALLEGLMKRGEAATLGELVFLFDR